MEKSEQIHIRASEGDKQIIRAFARLQNQTVSEYMLRAAMDVRLASVIDIETVKEIVRGR